MASIEKRGEGRYVVRWRDPDGRARARSAPDARTARALLGEIERSIALGRRWEPPDHAAPTALVELDDEGEVVGGVFADYLDDRARVLAPATMRNVDRALTWFLKFLQQRYPTRRTFGVHDLTREHLVGYDAWNVTRGNAVGTRRMRVEHVQAAWAWAADQEIPGVGRPRTIEMPEWTGRIVAAPTWEQMDAAVAHLQSAWRRRLGIVMRYTGLRVEQAKRIRWDDVDLDRAQLRVRTELGKTRAERTGRVVPISRHLVAELRTWARKSDAVVHGAKISQATQFARAWEAAGVPTEVWDGRAQHAFRAGFQSELTRAGASVEAIEYLVGHALRGVRGHYIAPWALPLEATVALIPPMKAIEGQALRLWSRIDRED